MELLVHCCVWSRCNSTIRVECRWSMTTDRYSLRLAKIQVPEYSGIIYSIMTSTIENSRQSHFRTTCHAAHCCTIHARCWQRIPVSTTRVLREREYWYVPFHHHIWCTTLFVWRCCRWGGYYCGGWWLQGQRLPLIIMIMIMRHVIWIHIMSVATTWKTVVAPVVLV